MREWLMAVEDRWGNISQRRDIPGNLSMTDAIKFGLLGALILGWGHEAMMFADCAAMLGVEARSTCDDFQMMLFCAKRKEAATIILSSIMLWSRWQRGAVWKIIVKYYKKVVKEIVAKESYGRI